MITPPSSEIRDGEAARDRKSRRAVRALAAALARRCRGRTLLFGPDPGFAALMRAHHPDVEVGDPLVAGAPASAGRLVGSVVLSGVLDGLEEDEARQRLAEAWALVAPGGRLLATVPNPDAAAGEDARERRGFDRRDLTRLLRGLGKARLATDQPYRWLTMYVSKPREARPRENRTRRDRYRVTARLCKGRVIELGCGEGHLARAIADRANEVVGVDISRDKIARARAAYPDLAFFECDIARLSLPNASFDTAVLAEVLEHVDDALGAAFLATAWRLLRSGGRLIVSVPNEDCIPHRNHIRVFDRRSLRALLKPLGRPKLVTDQPYKWLMMHVDKG